MFNLCVVGYFMIVLHGKNVFFAEIFKNLTKSEKIYRSENNFVKLFK